MAKDEESFVVLLTEVPWWVSVIVAFFVYLTFKFYIPSIEFRSAVSNAFVDGLGNSAHLIALLFLIPTPFAVYKAWKEEKKMSMYSVGIDMAKSWSLIGLC